MAAPCPLRVEGSSDTECFCGSEGALGRQASEKILQYQGVKNQTGNAAWCYEKPAPGGQVCEALLV